MFQIFNSLTQARFAWWEADKSFPIHKKMLNLDLSVLTLLYPFPPSCVPALHTAAAQYYILGS